MCWIIESFQAKYYPQEEDCINWYQRPEIQACASWNLHLPMAHISSEPRKSWSQLPWGFQERHLTHPVLCLDALCWQSRGRDVSSHLDFISGLVHYVLPITTSRNGTGRWRRTLSAIWAALGGPSSVSRLLLWDFWGPGIVAVSVFSWGLFRYTPLPLLSHNILKWTPLDLLWMTWKPLHYSTQYVI